MEKSLDEKVIIANLKKWEEICSKDPKHCGFILAREDCKQFPLREERLQCRKIVAHNAKK